MPKKILMIILTLIAGAFLYTLSVNDDREAKELMMDMADISQPAPSPSSDLPTSDAAAGTYVEYAEGIVARTTATKLLFFYAAWCPQCRTLEADIQKNGVPSGVTIIKVDYDTNQALRQKYGVTLQTTIVRVDDNGKLVKKFVAYDDPSVNAVKENVL